MQKRTEYFNTDPKVILLPVCIFLFFYVLYRAWHLSFTHDEGLSYELAANGDFFAYTANNHLLNTWLMALCSRLFGNSELSLRLPNVLLFAVYLFFGSKLLVTEKRKLVFIVFALPLLFLNPFVLDFFAMARGYGLCMGFLMAALYYFLRNRFEPYAPQNFLKDFIPAVIYATLALLSNLSLVNFYIALLAVFFWQYLSMSFKNRISLRAHAVAVSWFLLALVPLFFSLKRLLVLSEANGLYAGAGSFDESITTFIERSAYFIPYPLWFTEFLQSFIELIFPVGLIITLLRKNANSRLFKLGVLMTLILAGFYLEHYLFSTLFPISRTGIYFIPLFGLFIVYLFTQFTENASLRLQPVYVSAGVVLVTLSLTIHFLRTMNTRYFFEWKYDAHTREVVEAVSARGGLPVLEHNWIFGPAIHYYIHGKHLQLQAVRLEGPPSAGKFVYEFQENMKDPAWRPVALYNDAGSGLYEK